MKEPILHPDFEALKLAAERVSAANAAAPKLRGLFEPPHKKPPRPKGYYVSDMRGALPYPEGLEGIPTLEEGYQIGAAHFAENLGVVFLSYASGDGYERDAIGSWRLDRPEGRPFAGNDDFAKLAEQNRDNLDPRVIEAKARYDALLNHKPPTR